MKRPTDDELKAAHQAARYESDLAEQALQEMRAQKARAEALDAKLKEAVEVMQRVKDYRYDPNIGIELNRLEAFLASLEGDKP